MVYLDCVHQIFQAKDITNINGLTDIYKKIFFTDIHRFCTQGAVTFKSFQFNLAGKKGPLSIVNCAAMHVVTELNFNIQW